MENDYTEDGLRPKALSKEEAIFIYFVAMSWIVMGEQRKFDWLQHSLNVLKKKI